MAVNLLTRRFSKLHSNDSLFSDLSKAFYKVFDTTATPDAKSMPVVLRLAFHDAGTYDKSTNTGGPKGSIRLPEELAHDSNKGVEHGLKVVIHVQKSFSTVSWADLIQAAGVLAVKYCGGPEIPFRFGRVDSAQSAAPGLLPSPFWGVKQLRQNFYRMGLTDVDLVALSGAHTLGRSHIPNNGYPSNTPWTKNEIVFDNSYYIELLANDNEKLLRLNSDNSLLTVPELKFWVEKFAEDNDFFFREYAVSHKKLSELGWE
jgi:L-ascorbate peroxidase